MRLAIILLILLALPMASAVGRFSFYDDGDWEYDDFERIGKFCDYYEDEYIEIFVYHKTGIHPQQVDDELERVHRVCERKSKSDVWVYGYGYYYDVRAQEHIHFRHGVRPESQENTQAEPQQHRRIIQPVSTQRPLWLG